MSRYAVNHEQCRKGSDSMDTVYVYIEGEHMGIGPLWNGPTRVFASVQKAADALLAPPTEVGSTIQTDKSRDEIVAILEEGKSVTVPHGKAGMFPSLRVITPLKIE